jgi:hypothetical protein
VDGDGNIRCAPFFAVIGNLYSPAGPGAEVSQQTCGCYIGYVHLPRLEHGAVRHRVARACRSSTECQAQSPPIFSLPKGVSPHPLARERALKFGGATATGEFFGDQVTMIMPNAIIVILLPFGLRSQVVPLQNLCESRQSVSDQLAP